MLIKPTLDNRECAPAPVGKRKVLIVDDHPVFREGMSQVIEQESDLEVCGEAANADAAIEAVRNLLPDLALLDISLRGTNGIDLLKQMKAIQPHLPVIIVSMHDESLYALPSLRAGASGYLMKCEAVKQVVAAMRRVLAGEVYVSSEISDRLIFKALHSLAEGEGSPVDSLAESDLKVLQLIGRGLDTSEIARQMQVSVAMIESHRAQIQEKLGCKSIGDMVRFAIDWSGQPSAPV